MIERQFTDAGLADSMSIDAGHCGIKFQPHAAATWPDVSFRIS
jgi:hypothetical protein